MAASPSDTLMDKVAEAQARRDRARLIAAHRELFGLRRRVEELERSPFHRILAPARQFVQAAAPVLRASQNLLRKPGPVTARPLASGGPCRGRALVIDHSWPQPDRDAGSVEIVNLMESLDRLGFEVILAASREHDIASVARNALVRRGLRCLGPNDSPSVEAFLREHGQSLDLCVLCRVFCGGEFLEEVQRSCPTARVVFNSIDLNFLREERKALLLGDPEWLEIARRARLREDHLIRSSDATMVVSAAELGLLAQTTPEALVVHMPLGRPVQPPVTSWEQRQGIGFIGGFTHAPNADAVRYFLAEVWPLVLRDLPDCPLSLVGEGMPPNLLDGCPGRVSLRGHVPDVGPWFESLRLTVAPLRFGAGAKGKVASSLAAGVPCIATPVAAEGMGLNEAAGVMVAETPATFSAAIRTAYTDPKLWRSLSADGLAYAEHALSLAGWQARLNGMLKQIGL